MARSSVAVVKSHLRRRGPNVPMPEKERDVLEVLMRRCEQAQTLSQASRSVAFSPYMKVLLRVSGLNGQDEHHRARKRDVAGC